MAEASNPFGLTPPLRIVQLDESVKVIDAGERVAAYIHVAAGRERHLHPMRLSPAEGVEVAKVIAQALTDAIERGPAS